MIVEFWVPSARSMPVPPVWVISSSVKVMSDGGGDADGGVRAGGVPQHAGLVVDVAGRGGQRPGGVGEGQALEGDVVGGRDRVRYHGEAVQDQVRPAGLDQLDGVPALHQAADGGDDLLGEPRGGSGGHALDLGAVDVDVDAALVAVGLRQHVDPGAGEGVVHRVAVGGGGVNVVVEVTQATSARGTPGAGVGDARVRVVDRGEVTGGAADVQQRLGGGQLHVGGAEVLTAARLVVEEARRAVQVELARGVEELVGVLHVADPGQLGQTGAVEGEAPVGHGGVVAGEAGWVDVEAGAAATGHGDARQRAAHLLPVLVVHDLDGRRVGERGVGGVGGREARPGEGEARRVQRAACPLGPHSVDEQLPALRTGRHGGAVDVLRAVEQGEPADLRRPAEDGLLARVGGVDHLEAVAPGVGRAQGERLGQTVGTAAQIDVDVGGHAGSEARHRALGAVQTARRAQRAGAAGPRGRGVQHGRRGGVRRSGRGERGADERADRSQHTGEAGGSGTGQRHVVLLRQWPERPADADPVGVRSGMAPLGHRMY